MTTYWLDFTTGGGTDDGGDGSQGNPFKSPYAARTAMATGGNVFMGKGRYVRLNTGAAGRVIQPPASGTPKNPTIFHGYDPANPFEWWAGSMLRTTAAGGPTWTADGGDVHHCSLGFNLGAGEDYGGRLLWYYDPATPAVPPRQLYWMPDAVGGAQAGCVATVDSFWFNTSGNVLYVHLRSGESPNGKIIVPDGVSGVASYGDRWDTATNSGNGLFAGRKNIVFSNFSYLYCGSRPWSYQVASYPNGHDCERVELRRGWFGFTGRDDRGVIMPIARSGPIIIDECRLQCGSLGIIYSWSGQVGSHVTSEQSSAPGHVAVGLRATRNHLLDAGYTHRGQGDGHAVGAQANASDWIIAGNLCDKTVRPIVMWPRDVGQSYPWTVLNRIKVRANTIINTHDSGVATAQRMISWEGGDWSAALPNYDQSGSEITGNVIRGPITRIAATYYNGPLLDLTPYAGTKYDSPCGIRAARTATGNLVPVYGDEISGMSIGLSEEQVSSDPTIAVDYRWNKVRSLTQLWKSSLQAFVYLLSNIGVKAGRTIDRNQYFGIPAQLKAGTKNSYYTNLSGWRDATGNDANSMVIL